MNNLKRRVVWDRGGVSEVIGTILTLSITVVLFSGIIAMVDQFPAPGDNVSSDFVATLEPINGTWTEGAFIHITNTGGQNMTFDSTQVVISVDNETFNLRTTGMQDGRPYGLGPGVWGHRGVDNGDNNWDTGERWTFPRDETQINRNSNVNALVYDREKGVVAWEAKIQGHRNMFGPVVSNIRVDSNLDSIRMDPVQFGRPFYLFADVYDPNGDLDYDSVYADLSSFTLGSHIPMYHIGNGVFRSMNITGPEPRAIPIGYHIAFIHASDESGMHSKVPGRIPVGVELKGLPNLVINERNLHVSDYTPTNHQIVTFTVTVMNYGGWCNGTLTFHDVVDPSTDPVGKFIASSNFTISDGPDQITRIVKWAASPGGSHMIRINALPINALDGDPTDNQGFINVTVMPTILLVDDDNHPSDFSARDTVSYMRGALDSCDFKYDMYTVGTARSGPGYEYGERALKNYDVVIWMTGHEKTHTLTLADQANLTSYLSGPGRAGSLWLIGQYILSDTFVQASFRSLIHLWDLHWSFDGPGASIQGVTGNPVSDEWENDTIPITTRLPGHAGGWRIQPTSDAQVTFNEDATDTPPWGDALNYENVLLDSRIVFFPWEFSRIASTSDQAQVAYKVLNWLGSLPTRHGDDIAVCEQTLDPSFVFFNQEVTVTATVRNNGPTNITAEAGLFLNGGNEPIEWVGSLSIAPNGGTATLTGKWIATVLGTHVLKWRVDPNNLIQETNEGNNEVPSHVHTGEVFVEFRILVVDDDQSDNNNGTLSNDTAHLTYSLDRLGYMYESHLGVNRSYEVMGNDDGPDIEYLKNYSAVLWVTGESLAGISDRDANHLENYTLNYGGRLWLSGNDLFSGLSGVNRSRFLSMLGIADALENQWLSGTLRGVENSPISHGMNFSIASNGLADLLVPDAGSGAFYMDYAFNSHCAVAYAQGSYHAFTSAFSFETLSGANASFIRGDNARDEFTFMLLRWTGRPETRNELRITEKDYFLNDWHPQIGSAYVLRARVHNVGANDANILVRFMDGNVQIGSDSISIAPGAMTSAELIWRPLFAGLRTIRVLADPIGDVPEIFQWFNNNITFQIYVYFFWDDMESGTSKWSHSSTIININGESPLDYYTTQTLYTGISRDWDPSLSFGVENVTKTSYSYPQSYYMEEGTGMFGKADVLISFALDDSKSMSMRYFESGTWLDAAKNAAKTLLSQLSDDSVCVSIWDFNGNNERRWSGPSESVGGGRLQTDNANRKNIERAPVRLGDTFVSTINGSTIDGRQYIRDEINAMDNPPGQTILWDAIGEAYLDIKHFTPIYPDLLPVVIALSDGMDIQSSDGGAVDENTAKNKVEGGSDFWAPWDMMSAGSKYYDVHRGKYTLDWADNTRSYWMEAMRMGSMQHTRTGLLGADLQIFTVGLGLEHHDDPTTPNVMEVWLPEMTTWPLSSSTSLVQDMLYATCTDASAPCVETGTLEYNLWRIANTSSYNGKPGMYFYAPTGDDLDGIFSAIGMMLATGFNQTRSATPEPETRAVHSNSDKRAVTEPFSLVNVSSAKLSFWHKYNILQGGNGAFLQVGYKTSALGDWQFKYIVPPGQYTGMLYHQYNVYDDFGTPVKWCWNGLSRSGTYGWDFANVDISSFVPQGAAMDGHVYRSEVVVAFNYTQFGGGTGAGWYIDNVKLDVTRAENAAINPDTRDIWKMTGSGARSGTHAWSNVDEIGLIRPGIDNSLMTMPIDLTGALNAQLSAYFKFNFNLQDGAPPDGFRVEVSGNGGVTWTAINQGVRTSWGISGTGFDAEDGKLDGKAYTGLTDNNNAMLDGYWVSANSLARLNVDLSAWVGSQIYIRFRMVTTNQLGYLHSAGDPGFYGFHVDDVEVTGDSIYG